MKKFDTELIVGTFILIGIVCMVYTSVKLGRVDLFNQSNYYPVEATFSSATGLRKDTNVEIAGVPVGTVKDIELDDYQAKVTLSIKKNVELQDDVIASIKTKGLLGERYISIEPGSSDIVLGSGDVIFDTEPPLDIEGAIKHFFIDEE